MLLYRKGSTVEGRAKKGKMKIDNERRVDEREVKERRGEESDKLIMAVDGKCARE